MPATSQPAARAARHDVAADEAVGAGDGEARHGAPSGRRGARPAPLSARPGVAPVCSPSRRTGTPLTSTCRMPTAYWCGLLEGRAVRDRRGIEDHHVGEGARRSMPRSARPRLAAGSDGQPPDRLRAAGSASRRARSGRAGARSSRRRADGSEDFRNTPSGRHGGGVGAEATPRAAGPACGRCPPTSGRTRRRRACGPRAMRSRIVFSASLPRIVATSASVFPVSGFSASVLNSTSSRRSGEPAARQRFSQPSARRPHRGEDPRRASAGSASRRNSASYPPSRAHGGRQASKPVAPAV